MNHTALAERLYPKHKTPRRTAQRTPRRTAARFFLERLEERSLLSTGLVAAYNFDAGSGTVLADVSGTTASTTTSIWSNSATPSNPSEPDSSSVELGVQFHSDVNGSITGLKFYKGSTNTGTHVADLWTSSGTLLATATFTNETASGWQQVNFSSPVAITAGTTYVASYHTNVGYYADDQGYFSSQYNSGQLHVPANGGVYAYGAAGSFPTQVWNASNYWVDIVFSPGTSNPPTVTSETPASNATNVPVATTATATFNEAVQSSTISFTLQNSSGSTVAGSVSYNSTTNVTTFTPTSALASNTTYKATVSRAQSTSGVSMTAPFSWSFTTAAAVTPTVTSETPATSATGVATNSNVTATFNEAVQASSITTSDFVLKGPSGSSVTATVAYNSSTNTATLTPSSLRANSTIYTATISGVTDAAGHTMANPFSWSFTTDPAPAVTTCSPASNATGVAVSSPVTATFNEAVQSGTIGFTLTNPSGSTVAATVAYNSSTNTATLTPSAALAFSTKYTATVSGAKDTAGDPMAAPYSWSFTTAAAPPSPPPSVTTETPTTGTTGVATNTTVTATFNESVQASSVNTTNFTLTGPSSTVVPATVTYTDSTHTATLSPRAALAYSTTYTASLSGVLNASGTPMTGPYSWTFTTAASTGALNEPLLYQSNLQYVGAFRVPADGSLPLSEEYDYGGTALAYNPANNSLFMVGHPQYQEVGEFSIPSSIINDPNPMDLAQATSIQTPTNVISRIPNQPIPDPIIGGLMVVNGQLIGSMYANYNATGATYPSHFMLNSLNLSTASVTGLFNLGNYGAGFVGGYMTPVPAEWQPYLGEPFITGNQSENIVSQTSNGPAAFGFNPATLGPGVNPVTPYLDYPLADPLGPPAGPADPLWSAASNVNGIVFVPGTRSVLYFGSTALNAVGYGEASQFNDTTRTSKGYHSQNGAYAYQVWAYDATDFLAVENGQMNPWNLRPYATWTFNFPQPPGPTAIGGAAYNPATQTLYLVQQGGEGHTADGWDMPLIQVYHISLGSDPSVSQPSTGAALTTNAAISQPSIAQPLVISVAPTNGKDTGAKPQTVQYNGVPGQNTLIQIPSPGSKWTQSGTGKTHKALGLFGINLGE